MKFFTGGCLALLILAGCLNPCCAKARKPLSPVVEVQEDVYPFTVSAGGVGPMWCYGSTCVARSGDDVFVSGLETDKNAKPLNTVRWVLYKRTFRGWELQQKDEKYLQREPCPLATLSDGKLYLSSHPHVGSPQDFSGAAEPALLQFSASESKMPYISSKPAWTGNPPWVSHSYRTLAADRKKGDILLFTEFGNVFTELDQPREPWSFRDSKGEWSAKGELVYPFVPVYGKPQSVRLCYPDIMLKNRAAYFLGVSDIVEPVKEWRDYKREATKQDWDYDFRRLFFSWTPDVRTQPFGKWIEIANRDKTCGWITNCDLYVDNQGLVYILWMDRSTYPGLREKFFPNEKFTISLNYCILKDGKEIDRRSLLAWDEDKGGLRPKWARFHVTADNRLVVIYDTANKYTKTEPPAKPEATSFYIREIVRGAEPSAPVGVGISGTWYQFMTATVRAGNKPSNTIDLIGASSPGSGVLQYARIRLK